MSGWQKISLRDAVGKVAFDDEWGFIRFDGKIFCSVGGQDISYYYVSAGGTKKQIVFKNYDFKELASIFSKELYYRNSNYRYYRDQEEYISVEVEEITITINANRGYGYNTDRLTQQRSFVIKKQDKNRLEYLRHVWICDEIQDDKFHPDTYLKQPLYKDFKVGNEIIFKGSKHVITEVYPQPNADNYMVAAKPYYDGANGEAVNITFNDKVYVLPYNEQPASEVERFNTNKNEFELSPYAIKSGQLLNVYWNKIEDASDYTVSLYKKCERPYLQKIYHLKDYAVDRNDGFISIDGLLDEGYIVTVKAENRNGEEIALSRGISLSGNGRCLPQFWKE